LLNRAAAAAPVEACVCAVCGAALTSRGFEARQVHTQMGVITVRRRYYTCPAGHGGYAPFDAQLELLGPWSSGMQTWMQYVSAKDSFAGGAECLAQLSGQVVAPSSIRTVAEWHGARREAAQQEEMAQLRQRAATPCAAAAPAAAPAPARLYVAVDGAHVPERGEWKECKVGVVFATSARRPRHKRHRDRISRRARLCITNDKTCRLSPRRRGAAHGARKVAMQRFAAAVARAIIAAPVRP
jgi:hypothetical protein